MQTSQGHDVYVDNLGHLGFLYKCQGKEIIVRMEKGSYFLYKDDSIKNAKSFASLPEAQQAVLELFDKLLYVKSPEKASKKKASKKKSPK